MKLFDELLKRELLLVCGTGGVGKTTSSAAIALRAALEGKNVALITIDPARRLASSLGLKKLGHSPENLNAVIQKQLGLKAKGSLSALMLDSENTLYQFLRDVGGQNIADRFRESSLFQIIADNFAGLHDYLAMEKLYALHTSGSFDFIVLDTPPARHTLDFLEAPDRIARFFDDRIFSWFLTDPRTSAITERLRAKGAKTALSVLEKITGEGVIRDLVWLAPHLYSVKNAFIERQEVVQKLLRSKASGALFVSSPTDLARGEAEPFLADAKEQKISVMGFLLNRSLHHLAPSANASKNESYAFLRKIVEEEDRNLERLKKLAGTKPLLRIPEFDEDIHTMEGLHALAMHF